MFFYRFGSNTSNNIFSSPAQKTQPGDLIFDGEYYYLNLGDEISRPEQWYTHHTITISQKIPTLCHHKTLARIHRMVNEWFSSYNKVLPLFFWSDIDLLLKHKKNVIARPEGSPLGGRNEAIHKQKLILFPSILSIQQYLKHKKNVIARNEAIHSWDDYGLPRSTTLRSQWHQWTNTNSLILTGSSTSVQKAKAYRAISTGQEQTIITTHSQIFQNRHNLTGITIMDPHSPYYHTFQEPRYTISTVIEKMRELYHIS